MNIRVCARARVGVAENSQNDADVHPLGPVLRRDINFANSEMRILKHPLRSRSLISLNFKEGGIA